MGEEVQCSVYIGYPMSMGYVCVCMRLYETCFSSSWFCYSQVRTSLMAGWVTGTHCFMSAACYQVCVMSNLYPSFYVVACCHTCRYWLAVNSAMQCSVNWLQKRKLLTTCEHAQQVHTAYSLHVLVVYQAMSETYPRYNYFKTCRVLTEISRCKVMGHQ